MHVYITSLVLVIAVINQLELYEYSSLSATVLRVRVLQDSTPAQLLIQTTHCTAVTDPNTKEGSSTLLVICQATTNARHTLAFFGRGNFCHF